MYDCQGFGIFPSLTCGPAQGAAVPQISQPDPQPVGSPSPTFFFPFLGTVNCQVEMECVIKCEDVEIALTSQLELQIEVASHWKPAKRPAYATVTREEEEDFRNKSS